MAPEAAAGKAAEHSSGLPQFDPTFWAGQMFWLVVIFALLYLLFRYVFIPRIGDTIAQREDRIGGDIGAARRIRRSLPGRAEPVVSPRTCWRRPVGSSAPCPPARSASACRLVA